MKKIKLTQGKFALVDDEDFEWLNQWKWYYFPHRKTGYAERRIRIPGNGRKRKTIRMHRLILDAPDGVLVDHKHGNGLDNRRSEIRLCNRSENGFNRGKTKQNSSGLKGAYWQKQINRWYSRITVYKKDIYLGTFDTAEQATEAYKKAALKYHGEFACVL